MIRVVVVEDDIDLCEETVFNLSEPGWDVVGVHDGASLYRHLVGAAADIIVLDVGLPGEDGFSIARHLRASPATQAVGIVMLTALGDADSRIAGLEHGADIYLVKSITIDELRANIASLARRLKLIPGTSAQNQWRYSSSAWTLTSPSGTDAKLSGSEKALIELFLAQGGTATRQDIVRKALGQDPATYDMRRLEVMVSRLRGKLQKASPLHQPLRAVHGVGYEFTVPLQRVS